jgi:hypothetical protein
VAPSILHLPPEGSILRIKHEATTDVGIFQGVQPRRPNGKTWRDRQHKIILDLGGDNAVHICAPDIKKVDVVKRARGKKVVVMNP